MGGESQFLMSAPPYNHQLLANPSTFYICTDPLLRKRLNARKETDLLGHRGPAGTQNLHPPLLGLVVLISNMIFLESSIWSTWDWLQLSVSLHIIIRNPMPLNWERVAKFANDVKRHEVMWLVGTFRSPVKVWNLLIPIPLLMFRCSHPVSAFVASFCPSLLSIVDYSTPVVSCVLISNKMES